MSRKIEQRAAQVPELYRTLYLRAVAGKLSPRQAIKAKCQECMGWEEVAHFVRGCTSVTCPLYPLRPYQASEGSGRNAQERFEGIGPTSEPPSDSKGSPDHAKARGEGAGKSGRRAVGSPREAVASRA